MKWSIQKVKNTISMDSFHEIENQADINTLVKVQNKVSNVVWIPVWYRIWNQVLTNLGNHVQ